MLVLERCTVRPWRLDDTQSVASHANNRKIWLGVRDLFPYPYTIQDAHEFLQRAISEQPEMRFVLRLMARPSAGSGFTRDRTCIGMQRQWVTGWASSSGDAAS
jgi:hypothetical protein